MKGRMMSDESKMRATSITGEKLDAPNLEQMDVSDLRKLIVDAQALEIKKIEQEKEKILSNFESEAAKLGFSVSVVWSHLPTPELKIRKPKEKESNKGKGTTSAKYKGPNGEEWSGRGRQAKWLTELEAAGRKREEFLVSQERGAVERQQ